MQDHVPSTSFRCFLLLPLLLGLSTTFACGAKEEPAHAESEREITPPEVTEPAPRSDRCLAVDEKLRSRLDKLRKNGSFDVSLQWQTKECAPAFVGSGVSALDAHSLFRVGSITKTYVAVLTLTLAAKGKLGLDDRLDAILPDAPPAIAELTVRQLLQHTSGLFNYTATGTWRTALAEEPMREWTPRELLDLALAEAPYSAPGAEWNYSNTGYVVLGMVLEAVGGKPIATLLREEVLVPNHLLETFFDGEEPVAAPLAPGFDTRGRANGSSYSLSWAWAAGAVVASASDVARFIELTGTKAIVPEAFRDDLEDGVPTPQRGLSYGLGVFLGDESVMGPGRGIGHGGDILGYHSWAWYLPEQETTLVAYVNSDTGDANAIVAAAMTAIFAEP